MSHFCPGCLGDELSRVRDNTSLSRTRVTQFLIKYLSFLQVLSIKCYTVGKYPWCFSKSPW